MVQVLFDPAQVLTQENIRAGAAHAALLGTRMTNMKNIFWWRCMVALWAALGVCASYADDVPAMVAHKVSPSAWYVEGVSALGSPANQNFISNAAFVVTPGGVVVIDALGSPPLATRLIAEIRKVTSQPITHVIATHYHADHIYGLQTFKALGAHIIAHRAAKEYLN